MYSGSFLRASMGYEIGNEKGWRDVVGVAAETGAPWNGSTNVVAIVYIDRITLTLVWSGPTRKRAPTLMSVDRRDSAALINIGALLPADPLRTGQRGDGEDGKVSLRRRTRDTARALGKPILRFDLRVRAVFVTSIRAH